MTQTQKTIGVVSGFAFAAVMVMASRASAQVTQTSGIPKNVANVIDKKQPPPPPLPLPPDYVIGIDDTLTINVFGDQRASGDVLVRPDGKIGLPQFGDEIVASGLRPEALKDAITKLFAKYYEEPIPTVSIGVKEIKSRKVYITGSVGKQGPYPLSGPMTIGQLISLAGGLLEFADKKDIVIVSATLKDKKGQPLTSHVNYNDLIKGKDLAKNNIELRPGDQVFVK